jgi:hypothetical protein
MKEKVGREDIFKLTIENKTFDKTRNENGVREANFTRLKNLSTIQHSDRPHLDTQKTTSKYS